MEIINTIAILFGAGLITLGLMHARNNTLNNSPRNLNNPIDKAGS